MALHLLFEVVGAILAWIPLYALMTAYRQTPSRRLALALVGFAIFEFRLVFMVLVHTFLFVDHSGEEFVDFAADLTVMAAFSASFLYGTRWFPERVQQRHPGKTAGAD